MDEEKTILAGLTSPLRFADGSGLSWERYVAALGFLDRSWRDRRLKNTAFGVFGDQPSWEDTIARAQPLFSLETWSTLDEDQISMIAPAHSFADGDALLGSVGRRSNDVRAFLYSTESQNDRDSILNLLKRARTLSAPTLPVLGGDILADMCSIRGMGRSFATRLLALARPDGFLVVNQKSQEWLQDASGLTVGNNFRGYNSLLRWLGRQQWYASPEPVDEIGRRAWPIRAALLDAFAYQPWR